MTAKLIDRLASDVQPVAPHILEREVAMGLGVGAVGALALVLAIYGVQPDLRSFAHGAPLVMKWAYALAGGGIAVAIAMALARPGSPQRHWRWLAVPALTLAALAAWQLNAASPADRIALILGGSWDKCPWRIVGLSLPVMAGLIVAVRRQAPVRLRRTGAAIGLLSGATAATFYALACTESSATFVLIWYSLGIGIATGLGAIMGPRLLRW